MQMTVQLVERLCVCLQPCTLPYSLLHNGYRDIPGGKERPGRGADPSPPSRAVVMKG